MKCHKWIPRLARDGTEYCIMCAERRRMCWPKRVLMWLYMKFD